MGGTSEKTTSSRSDTMKGLFTAINKAKFPFSNDAGKKVSVKTPLHSHNSLRGPQTSAALTGRGE